MHKGLRRGASMMDLPSDVTRLPDVGVPAELVSDAPAFGGTVVAGILCGTLVIRHGRAASLEPDPGLQRPKRIVLPGLVEAHVHLDKCHSIERCTDVGGDLDAAIAAQRRDKALWTRDDLAARAARGLAELIASGARVVRTHVDWGTAVGEPDRPLAWDVLDELASEAGAQGVIVQRAALTSIEEMTDPARAASVARVVAQGGGALGSFLLRQADREAGLRNVFALADRYGLALDFHVDEGLDPALDGLELIADVAADMRFEGRSCVATPAASPRAMTTTWRGSPTSWRPAGSRWRRFRRRTCTCRAGTRGTPDRRGITRLHELTARGVKTVIGTDNVRDAFCPVGRHDPVHSLALAVLAGHLDPPFGPHLRTVTSAARAALGLERCRRRCYFRPSGL
jgi:cytosine deaminase